MIGQTLVSNGVFDSSVVNTAEDATDFETQKYASL